MAPEAAKETVCVTGGSGGIGQALLAQLAAGYHVKALFRTESATSRTWQQRGCEVVVGDLAADAALATLVSGARFVFHCAAITGRASYDEAHAVNVEGTRRLARAAAVAGCERFVHVSSIAVYSGSSTAECTEDSEVRPTDTMPVYALTKLEAEQAVRDVAADCGLRYTILRPTCVYGPETKPYTLLPVELMRRGLPVVVGDGDGVLDVVYVADLVDAMLAAARAPAADGQVFNIGHEPVTFNHFYRYFGKLLNKPVRRLPLPIVNGMLRLLGFVASPRRPALQELQRGIRFIKGMATASRSFPSTKAKALIGYAPRYTLPLGMLETELWLNRKVGAGTVPYVLDGYGPLSFRPRAVVHPTSERELVEIARAASARGIDLRAIGSLHSLCPIPDTSGICIVLDRYNQVLTVEGTLVSVQAGMVLRDLNDLLARHHLALPVLGSIAAQTVAGAISTATHGGSIHHGTLSDYVEAVRIVKADGSVVDVASADPAFPGVVVSLGLLGIISTVTLRCVPAFTLQSRTTVRPASDVIASFDELQRAGGYVGMMYFPLLDAVAVTSIDRVNEENPDAIQVRRTSAASPAPSPAQRAAGKLMMRALKLLAWFLFHVGCAPLQRALANSAIRSARHVRIGPSDLILTLFDAGNGDRSPIQDMDVALPYAQAGAALAQLRQHFRSTRRFPLLPVHIRCSAASRHWLSPNYERQVCWLEFWQVPRSQTLYAQIDALLRPYRYRFHWGKETCADRDYIRSTYPQWNRFARLRREWDPAGRFMNDYLRTFFDPADTVAADLLPGASPGLREADAVEEETGSRA
jgi:L-gulono-1,4-lactone dehydrogenase